MNEQRKKGSVKELVDALLNIGTHEEFEKLVSDWRTIKGMHNDDSTLVVIRYDGNTEFNVGYEDSLKNLGQDDSKKTLMPVMKTNESEIDEEFIKDFMGSFEKTYARNLALRISHGKLHIKLCKNAERDIGKSL